MYCIKSLTLNSNLHVAYKLYITGLENTRIQNSSLKKELELLLVRNNSEVILGSCFCVKSKDSKNYILLNSSMKGERFAIVKSKIKKMKLLLAFS